MVLTRSITELCVADHRNDPAAIAAWTANKSVAGIEAMLADPGLSLFVALSEGHVAAVGALTRDSIGLNYVHPDFRFRGVSKSLLAAMEAALKAANVPIARLQSTLTARTFYLDQGWAEGPPVPPGRFIQAYPMHKRLD